MSWKTALSLMLLMVAPAASARIAAATDPQPMHAPLQGEAQIVVLTLKDLHDVGLDLNHLKDTASQLYSEVTLQRMTVQTMPTLVGPGSVVNLPIGLVPTGDYIPPRTHRVIILMAEMRPVASMLRDDLDEFRHGESQLMLPGETSAVFAEQMQQWSVNVDNIYGQLEILERACQHRPYDQGIMAQATWAIVEDAKELERIRRAMYRALQREGKRAERENAER